MTARFTAPLFAAVAVVTLSSSAFAFEFPNNIPNGLQTAGNASASVNFTNPNTTPKAQSTDTYKIDTSDPTLSLRLTGSVSDVSPLGSQYANETIAGSIAANLSAAYGNLSLNASGVTTRAGGFLFFTGDFLYASTVGITKSSSVPDNLAYQDTLTLTSTTLPIGAPVSLKIMNTTTFGGSVAFQLTLASAFQASITTSGTQIPQPALTFNYNNLLGSDVFQDIESQIINAHVGDSLIIGGDVDISLNTRSFAGESFNDPILSQSLTLDLLTPGAAYTSASGTLYATTPAPEPASLSLLAAPLLFIRRRKQSSAP